MPLTVANPIKSYPSKVHIICCLLQPIDELLMGVASSDIRRTRPLLELRQWAMGFCTMTRRSDVNLIGVIIFPIVPNGLRVTRVAAKCRTCLTTPLRDYVPLRLPSKTSDTAAYGFGRSASDTTIPSSFVDRSHPASANTEKWVKLEFAVSF